MKQILHIFYILGGKLFKNLHAHGEMKSLVLLGKYNPKGHTMHPYVICIACKNLNCKEHGCLKLINKKCTNIEEVKIIGTLTHFAGKDWFFDFYKGEFRGHIFWLSNKDLHNKAIFQFLVLFFVPTILTVTNFYMHYSILEQSHEYLLKNKSVFYQNLKFMQKNTFLGFDNESINISKNSYLYNCMPKNLYKYNNTYVPSLFVKTTLPVLWKNSFVFNNISVVATMAKNSVCASSFFDVDFTVLPSSHVNSTNPLAFTVNKSSSFVPLKKQLAIEGRTLLQIEGKTLYQQVMDKYKYNQKDGILVAYRSTTLDFFAAKHSLLIFYKYSIKFISKDSSCPHPLNIKIKHDSKNTPVGC